MALKGTLKDFSVADVFQLIGQQQKSGSLYVKHGEKEAHIVFDRGKIVLGTFRQSEEDFLLGTMFLRAGVITSEQLSQAMDNQKATMRSLGDILKSMGAITPAVLSEFIALQLKEVLFRVFQWKEGFYEFVAEQIAYNKSIIKPESTEGTLMDGFRMLDEWPGILGKIGSLETVLKKDSTYQPSSSPASTEEDFGLDDAFGPFDTSAPKKVPTTSTPMSTSEQKVFNLIDGRKSLQEIVYLSRLGTFETASAAAALVDRRSVEKVDVLSQTILAPAYSLKPMTTGKWLLSSIPVLLATFLISASLPVLAFGLRLHWSARYGTAETSKGRPADGPLTILDLKTPDDRIRLLYSANRARLENGKVPTSMEDFALESDLAHWSYRVVDEQPVLIFLP